MAVQTSDRAGGGELSQDAKSMMRRMLMSNH
jgi:hypothetical protein